ncbi:hypothetical protein Aduo_012114 [Ancylostoma duodenale]
MLRRSQTSYVVVVFIITKRREEGSTVTYMCCNRSSWAPSVVSRRKKKAVAYCAACTTALDPHMPAVDPPYTRGGSAYVCGGKQTPHLERTADPPRAESSESYDYNSFRDTAEMCSTA